MNHINFSPVTSTRKVIITYKNFPVSTAVSHIGLGVSALNTAKVLKANGIFADVWPVLGAKNLADRIIAAQATGTAPSHVVIAAPWIPTLDLQSYLVFKFPEIQFVVVCHSNVGFLQGDPDGVRLFREALDLEQGALNFQASGNSKRFCNWVSAAYNRPCMWLPNLYNLDRESMHRRPWSGGTLKIGVFGAIRPLKNLLSAGAAALEISADWNTAVELNINAGRIEGGQPVIKSLKAMLASVPNITLVENQWQQWSGFRRLIKSMNLLLQPSYTESFNMVTADGAAESVPSVVSDAIDWAPEDWKANVDDVLSITRTAKNILNNPHAGAEGFAALKAHNNAGIIVWKNWLEI